MPVEKLITDSWYSHDDHEGENETIQLVDVEDGVAQYLVYERHGGGPGNHTLLSAEYEPAEEFREKVKPADITVAVEPVALFAEANEPQ